jgi:CHAT domain-containing protein/tetratricopeptide (TPR) repeat protein
MTNSSLSGRYELNSWPCRLLPVLLAFFLATGGKGQDPACHERLAGKVSKAASMILAGRYGMADATLEGIETEMNSGCPGDSAITADVAYLRGNIRLLQDDPGEALDFYRTARTYANSLVQLSRIDQNTGAVWFAENDYNKAIRFFSHALAELESSRANFPRRLLDLYDNLGAAYYENGNLDGAGRWWDLSQQTAGVFFPSDSVLLTKIAHNSALVLFGLKDWEASIGKFRLALALNPQKGLPFDKMTAMITKNLAMALMKAGQTTRAGQVLEIYTKAGEGLRNDDPVFMAEILRLKAWISFTAGHTAEADSLLEAGITLVRDTAGNIFPGLTDLTRFRLLRDRSSMFYLLHEDPEAGPEVSVDTVYMLQQQALAALSRFRTPDGSLAGFILLHDSVDLLLQRYLEAGFSLKSKRKCAVEELLSAWETFRRNPKRADANGIVTGEQVSDSLVKRWLKLNRKLYLAEKRGIGNPGPTNETVLFNLKNEMDTLQERMLPSGRTDGGTGGSRLSSAEAILDFAVFSDRIYIFIVRDSGSFMVAVTPGESFRKDYGELVGALATADDRMTEIASRRVSEVLIDPVVPFLEGVSRLYVLPGRSLCAIPFECLRPITSEGKRTGCLAGKFTVSYHSSVAEVTPDPTSAFAGNEPHHPRSKYDFIAFSPAFGGPTGQARLGNAEGEAGEIVELFRKAGCSVKLFSGDQADESALMEELLSGEIIHIATHSKVDLMHPEQSGLQLWKQSPVTSGDELLDGILEMGEVRGLRLNCDLLTLSSCTLDQQDETGNGTYDRAEADFINAGAQRVLSSLWNVSDRHTRLLMNDFYRFYLEGNTFPESLRKAKVKMMENPATASPYFWAAFILTTK